MTPKVPRLWPGATVVCIGGGPSLTVEDVEFVRNKARVIAINDAYKLAPWAEVLYAADARWIDWHDGVPSFEGLKYSIEGGQVAATTRQGWRVLRNTAPVGLELDPSGLGAGFDSGYQALNLAVHLGARRILLLGYDMGLAVDGRSHWFGEHPAPTDPSLYSYMREAFASLVEPLAALGIEVINCSRRTALAVFPRASLSTALAERAA